jgi:CDP-glycerol glycerophosphotransferase (TagB/SpsB family)
VVVIAGEGPDPEGVALGECLRQVLSSTHAALEVLVVGRRAFPHSWARSWARRVRSLPDASVDDAVAQASGEYVVFVDPADVVPVDAWAAMVTALESSGSDLAVGQRQTPEPQPWQASLFIRRRTRQTPHSCPLALVDLSAANKVFRRPWWRRCDLRVGGGAPGPDVVMAAYLAADGFDVLPDVVSQTPARDAAKPVSERPQFQAETVRRRLAALATVAAIAPAGWRSGCFTYLLPPWYVDAVAGGEQYFDALRTGVDVLARGLDPATVPVAARLGAWTVLNGTLPDVALVQDFLADNPHGLPAEADLVSVPDGLSASPPAPWRAVCEVDRRVRSWVAEGPVPREGGGLLRGATFTEYVVDNPLPSVEVVESNGVRTPLRVMPRIDPSVNEWAERAWEDRSSAAWEASFDGASTLGRPGRQDVEIHLGNRTLRHQVVVPPPVPKEATVINAVTLTDGVLHLSGSTPEESLVGHLAGRGGRHPVSFGVDGGRWECRVPLTTRAFGEAVGLPRGRYGIRLQDGHGNPCTTVWGQGLAADPPDLFDLRHRITLVTDARVPTVHLRPPLRPLERGAFGQQDLQCRVYVAPRTASYGSTVLLETFRGRSVGDSPGAIGRELSAREVGADLVCVVDDPGVQVPPGMRALVRGTEDWYDVLANARFYVANAGAPYWFEKKAGQTHLQTWHGTPLKRIGEDRGPGDFQTWRHRRRIARQAAGWDAFVSPSPYCSAIFRSAFRFAGPLLETGYPRNDVLVHDDGDLGAMTRQRLGIGADQRVVMYAPTWREYVGVRDSKPLYLDAERVTARLSDTVVLIRGHYNSTAQREVFTGHRRILDVTRYPEIADLYLAADVLVTDYSSVMFDFALTDKPVVLLVPDFTQYRDVERGFYFDIESTAPGPLVDSTDEVIARLTGGDDHAAARAEFRRRFCPFDDGQASARVVDWLLSQW